MRRLAKILILSVGLAGGLGSLSGSLFAAQRQKINPNPFTVRLVPAAAPLAPGEPINLNLQWQLADGYHAYLDQFAVKVVNPPDTSSRLVDIRDVIEFDDKISKQVRQGVKGKGTMVIRLEPPAQLRSGYLTGQVAITYQACAEDHCLLPKDVLVPFTAKWSGPALHLLGFAVDFSQAQIWLVMFLAGLLTSLTPCVFPLIPITLAVLGARRGRVSRRHGFLLSLAYVLGIAVTYALLGVVAASTGALFGSILGQPLVVAAFAILFVAMGLSMLGWFTISTPSFVANRLLLHKTQGGLVGAFMAGNVAGVVASPCVGPVLAATLAYIAQTQNLWFGFALMFVFALGFGQLFLALGTFSGLQKLLPRSGPWMEAIKFVFAVTFFGLAIFYLRPWLSTESEWRLLGLAVLLALVPPDLPTRWRERRPQVIRVALIWLLSAFAASFVLTGGPPAWRSPAGETTTNYPRLPWQEYSEQRLVEARAAGKPVVIDFYADWCVACKELEINTFSHPSIQELKDAYVFLKFDATRDSPEFAALKERYGIVGLPHLVFYNQRGEHRADLTLLGFEDAPSFRRRLDQLKAASN